MFLFEAPQVRYRGLLLCLRPGCGQSKTGITWAQVGLIAIQNAFSEALKQRTFSAKMEEQSYTNNSSKQINMAAIKESDNKDKTTTKSNPHQTNQQINKHNIQKTREFHQRVRSFQGTRRSTSSSDWRCFESFANFKFFVPLALTLFFRTMLLKQIQLVSKIDK